MNITSVIISQRANIARSKFNVADHINSFKCSQKEIFTEINNKFSNTHKNQSFSTMQYVCSMHAVFLGPV